jgi:hypothetical protein
VSQRQQRIEHCCLEEGENNMAKAKLLVVRLRKDGEQKMNRK